MLMHSEKWGNPSLAFGDGRHYPVLHASVCWTFRNHHPPVLKPEPTTPSFQNLSHRLRFGGSTRWRADCLAVAWLVFLGPRCRKIG